MIYCRSVNVKEGFFNFNMRLNNYDVTNLLKASKNDEFNLIYTINGIIFECGFQTFETNVIHLSYEMGLKTIPEKVTIDAKVSILKYPFFLHIIC